MEYKSTEIRTWSILGSRGTFGMVLTDLAKENHSIVAMSADLCNTSGLDRFATAYPERFYNAGIAEQNMIGVAAGMADSGYIPFATTFSSFASMRACEMVRHFMGYMQSNIKLVGFGAGFAMELFGNTHYAMEDLAILRSIPGIVILSPADGLEIRKAMETAVEIKQPVYIRLTGMMNQPIIYKKDYNFELGKAVRLKEGDAVAIFATGTMVSECLKAAKSLEEAGISCAVLDVHTIEPLDKECIREYKKCKLIVTAEEHFEIGGLGSVVADVLSQEEGSPLLLKIGIKNQFQQPGSYHYLMERNGLTAEHIAIRVKDKYNEIMN